MRFSLSIVLDKNGRNRQDLYKTSTLKELDDYLLSFKNHLEIRDKYLDDVSEFLLDNMNYIRENEKKNKRVNNGRICITYIGKNNEIRMFPIIYRDDPKLMSRDNCLRKIKREFNDDDKLRELINRKRYLLSDHEIGLITNYLMYHVSYKKYKRIFINDFISRLTGLSDDKLYMYLRSLMNLCDLKTSRVIPTKYGDINVYEDNISERAVLQNCDDELFIKLYNEEDYESLYNLYDADVIHKYGVLGKSKK